MNEVWHGTVHIDSSLIARRDRGDSPYVRIFNCTEPECALPLGHLCDHITWRTCDISHNDSLTSDWQQSVD